jgi:hypothetical protein
MGILKYFQYEDPSTSYSWLFPTDVWLLIFSFIDSVKYIGFIIPQVCKGFKDLCSSPILWKSFCKKERNFARYQNAEVLDWKKVYKEIKGSQKLSKGDQIRLSIVIYLVNNLSYDEIEAMFEEFVVKIRNFQEELKPKSKWQSTTESPIHISSHDNYEHIWNNLKLRSLRSCIGDSVDFVVDCV